MPSKVQEYEADDIIVRYDVGRCIHAAECVHGLPEVFDPDKKPWVEPGAASADEVSRVVRRCPSGALTFRRKDGGPSEKPPEPGLREVEDGPVYVQGRVKLMDPDGNVLAEEHRVALCRCGASRNKPYCDNSHQDVGFRSR